MLSAICLSINTSAQIRETWDNDFPEEDMAALITGRDAKIVIGSYSRRLKPYEIRREQRRYYYYDSFLKGWSFRFALGTPSEPITDRFVYGREPYGKYDYALPAYVSGMSGYFNEYYGPTTATCAINLGADRLLCRWFSLGLDLNIEGRRNFRYDPYTGPVERQRGTAIVVMPQAKFIYLNRPYVRIYGSIGLGLSFHIGFDELSNDLGSSSSFIQPAYQLSPIGLEVGNKVFGFAEYGYGFLFSAFRAGVGFKL